MIISIIVAHSKNNVIGIKNSLPWKIPSDLKRFKIITMNKPIIMGRKTFESIGKPLPDRRNIVITRNNDWHVPGVEKASSLEEALLLTKNEEEVVIIGGEQIYKQAIQYANKMYISEVDCNIDGDAFFPQFDDSEWEEKYMEVCKEENYNNFGYKFKIIIKKDSLDE